MYAIVKENILYLISCKWDLFVFPPVCTYLLAIIHWLLGGCIILHQIIWLGARCRHTVHWCYCSKLQPPRSSDTRVRGSDETWVKCSGTWKTDCDRKMQKGNEHWKKRFGSVTKRLMITRGERGEPERPAALNHCGHNPPYHWNKQLLSYQLAKQHIMLGASGSTNQEKIPLSIPPLNVQRLQPGHGLASFCLPALRWINESITGFWSEPRAKGTPSQHPL